LKSGKVTVNGKCPSPEDRVLPKNLRIEGAEIPFLAPYKSPDINSFNFSVHIVMHKPKDYICSRVKEQEKNKIVYDILPVCTTHKFDLILILTQDQLIKMQKPVLSIAGRLDKFVSGLVILSQDGISISR
jgi:16S rRNA U516 pseudouridylate synthase RsuA-like enzyme